jgi:hypothetical protein
MWRDELLGLKLGLLGRFEQLIFPSSSLFVYDLVALVAN